MDLTQIFYIWLLFGDYENKLISENQNQVTFVAESLICPRVGRMSGRGDEES